MTIAASAGAGVNLVAAWILIGFLMLAAGVLGWAARKAWRAEARVHPERARPSVRQVARKYRTTARARPLGCLLLIVMSAGMPLLLIGLLDHDHTVTIIGLALAGASLLDTMFGTPIRAVRRQRTRRDTEQLDSD